MCCFHDTDATELPGDIAQLKDYQNPNKWNFFLFPSQILLQREVIEEKKKKKSLKTKLN